MRQRTTLIIALIILIACGLAGGLAAQASFSGSSGPGPAQSAQFTPNPGAGGAPVISYQGVLQEGVNAYSGETANMTFTIYEGGNQDDGGTEIWQEYQPGITVSETGYFSTLIGTGSPISQALFSQTGSPMFLEVKVGTQTMSPRQRLAGVPYAFHAYYSGTAIYAASAGTAGHANYADDAGNAYMLDGKDSAEFLDKATYDFNTNNVVDHAELADVAIYANNADKLDNHDSGSFMFKSDYDNTPGDGRVDEADWAATADWAENAAATQVVYTGSILGDVSAGQVIGVDGNNDLAAGSGGFDEPTTFSSGAAQNLAVARISPTQAAVAYADKSDEKGKVCICERNSNTWDCGDPFTFTDHDIISSTSYVDIAYIENTYGKYIIITYLDITDGQKAWVWAGEVDGSVICPGDYNENIASEQIYTTVMSEALVDDLPGNKGWFVVMINNGNYPMGKVGELNGSGTLAFSFGVINTIENPTGVHMANMDLAGISDSVFPARSFVIVGQETALGQGRMYMGYISSNKNIFSFLKVGDKYSSVADESAVGPLGTVGNVLITYLNKSYYNNSINNFGCYTIGRGTLYDAYKPFAMSTLDNLAMDVRGGIDIAPNTYTFGAVIYTELFNRAKGMLKLFEVNESGWTVESITERVFSNSPAENTDIVWLDDDFFAIVYTDIFEDSKGKIVLGSREWISPVGIAKEPNLEVGGWDIVVSGIVGGLTELEPGQTYYGTLSGDLTTINTGCRIGTALSSTELLLNMDY